MTQHYFQLKCDKHGAAFNHVNWQVTAKLHHPSPKEDWAAVIMVNAKEFKQVIEDTTTFLNKLKSDKLISSYEVTETKPLI